MATVFDIDEFVEFALRSNIMLQDVMSYKEKPSHAAHRRLWAYAMAGEDTLWRLKKNLSSFRFRKTKYKQVYVVPDEGNKHLFCGFTVADLADPRSIYLIMDINFMELMKGVEKAMAREGKSFVGFTCGIFEKPRGNKNEYVHVLGRAIDVLVDGMNAKESYAYLSKLFRDEGFTLDLIEYPRWVHIGVQSEIGEHSPYSPERRTCNHLIPIGAYEDGSL